MHLFLSGKMKEADAAVKQGDPKAETLYYSLGELSFFLFFRRVVCVGRSAFTHSYTLYAGQTLIEAFKAFMSFEDQVCFTLCCKVTIHDTWRFLTLSLHHLGLFLRLSSMASDTDT